MNKVILHLPLHLNMSDEELFELCTLNKMLRIERTSKGHLIVKEPSGVYSGKRHSEIVAALMSWINSPKGSGVAFDSSAGFLLPNGAMRAPDVSWMRQEQWDSMSYESKESFAPLCPDFVVEVLSKSDSIRETMNKMEEWTRNGCRLAWMIDPYEEKAYIYRPDSIMEKIGDFNTLLSGEEVLPGFAFDLTILR